jgi:hypothetical protein
MPPPPQLLDEHECRRNSPFFVSYLDGDTSTSASSDDVSFASDLSDNSGLVDSVPNVPEDGVYF